MRGNVWRHPALHHSRKKITALAVIFHILILYAGCLRLPAIAFALFIKYIRIVAKSMIAKNGGPKKTSRPEMGQGR